MKKNLIIIILSITTIFSLGFGYLQKKEAERQREIAVAAQLMAEKSYIEVERQRKIAEENMALAERQRALAEAEFQRLRK